MVYLVSNKYVQVYCSSSEPVSESIRLIFGFYMEVPVPKPEFEMYRIESEPKFLNTRTESRILVLKIPNPKEPIRTPRTK